jgi:hypothetical protein
MLLAKAGSYELMYQLWRALTLAQGVSIDGAEPKEQVSEDVLRVERMALVKTKLPMLQKNMGKILILAESKEANCSVETQKTWKTIHEQATIAATALQKLSGSYSAELKTEEEKEAADKTFGSQAMFYADAVYELDKAREALRNH